MRGVITLDLQNVGLAWHKRDESRKIEVHKLLRDTFGHPLSDLTEDRAIDSSVPHTQCDVGVAGQINRVQLYIRRYDGCLRRSELLAGRLGKINGKNGPRNIILLVYSAMS